MEKLEDLSIFNSPWGHNIDIFEGVKFLDECLRYIHKPIRVVEYETKIVATLPKKLEKKYAMSTNDIRLKIHKTV